METFKVGLLGLGRGGMRVCDALLASLWGELVAVPSPKTQRLGRFVVLLLRCFLFLGDFCNGLFVD